MKTILGPVAIAMVISLTLQAEAEGQVAVGTLLRDCESCPEMVVIPPGSFQMGSDRIEPMKGGEMRPQGPVHEVTIPNAIAVGRYEVSNAEYGAFVAATNRPAQSCRVWGGEDEAFGFNWRNPQEDHLARGDEPVVCVYWNDALAYTAWLAAETGKPYRLLSEAEWEYAANGGSTATWPWGEDAEQICDYGNVLDQDGVNNPRVLKGATTTKTTMAASCSDGHGGVAPVGQYKPNGFGLYDMVGNIWEWAQDCSSKYYPDSPADGTAIEVDGPCETRAIRGGSWRSRLIRQRTTFRGRDPEPTSYHLFGFRVARDLE
ncbi:MAG: formylglycine-generating enzyme family protein [Gammaproteobacteria bacterium]